MAVLNLESLVLRGVAVLRDVQAVNLRRGTSYKATGGTPEVGNSTRHPSPDSSQDFIPPAGRLDHAGADRMDDAAPGTGRSQSRAGVLNRRSPARFAGRAIQSGWSHSRGGSHPAAATASSLLWACAVASVLETASVRPLAAQTRALPDTGRLAGLPGSLERATAQPAWCKPAGRTLPASTRGKGDR